MSGVKSHGVAPAQTWISRIGGGCALLLGILFLIPIFYVLMGRFLPDFLAGWMKPLSENWLTVIIRLHAAAIPVNPDPLSGFIILDLVILFLVDEVIFALAFPLLGIRNVGAVISLAQPPIGIILFVITQQAGRSAVMSSILTVCLVMLTREGENRILEWMGITGGGLLLLADITVGMIPTSFIANLAGVGYLILTIWFFIAALRLFQPAFFNSIEGD